MNKATAHYYGTCAAEIAASPVAPFFAVAFAAGSRVLDVGAGSGRDLANLLSLGFEGFSIEPADALRRAAVAFHPELESRLLARTLRDAVPEAFGQHAAHLLGRSPGGALTWESEPLTRLSEAVELTALQRG